MTRLTERLAMEQEDIAAMSADEKVCSTCKRSGILEHGICQNCWLASWQTNIAVENGKPVVSFTDYKAFYGMTPEEIGAHKVIDRRDDITKPDSTYSFPARTLSW